MSNWAYNLDMLAQNNVLDFDAPSYVMGQPPRYIGSPSTPPSPYASIPPAPALNQPEVDEFVQKKQNAPKKPEKDNNIVHNPSWKKWVFGALALGGLIFAGIKHKAIISWFKNIPSKFKNFSFQNTKTYITDKAKKVGNFFKKYWNKFTGWIKKR